MGKYRSNMYNFMTIAFVSLTLCLSATDVAQSDGTSRPEKIVLSSIAGSIAQEQAEKLITVLYENLGIDVVFERYPAKRALKFSNGGQTNGEVFRIFEVVKKNPNLRRIPTHLMTLRGFAYNIADVRIDDWDQLKTYRVGIQRGIVWAERGTKHLNVIRFNSNKELLDKLLIGGIDIAVAAEFSFEQEIVRNGTKMSFIRGNPLDVHKVYHYLHKDFIHLVELLDTEIRLLRAAGNIEKITGIRRDSE